MAVLAAMAAPLIALCWLAVSNDVGTDSLVHLATTVLPRYVWTSALLVCIVLSVVLTLGVSCAWLVAAYDFPGRGWLQAALMMPLALPAFVIAYAYTDALDVSGPVQTALRGWLGVTVGEFRLPDIRSVPGAGVVLGLALYPYVYMLARTAFAERSASLSEAARSLGLSPLQAWWRVVWPVARPSVAAGCALVLMETLADFGTVSYFAVDTFTAGIYRAWQGLGDKVTAARLAIVLLAVVGVLIWLERRQRLRMRYFGRGGRPAPRRALGRAQGMLVAVFCAAPFALGFVLPLLLLVRAWLASGAALDLRLVDWMLNTATLAALATLVTVPLALLGAYLGRLAAHRIVSGALALACAGYAMPGVVLGVGLLSWIGAVDRALGAVVLGGSIVAVVYAYLVRFFSVAFQGLESGLARISPSMDQSARSLGRSPAGVLREIHWPLLRPSLATAGLLVFVDCLKELPATLVLRPFDFDTLAVVAYHFAADERLGEAAGPALLIALVGSVPVLLLAGRGRRRDRHARILVSSGA